MGLHISYVAIAVMLVIFLTYICFSHMFSACCDNRHVGSSSSGLEFSSIGPLPGLMYFVSVCLCIRSCRHKCIPGIGEVGDNDFGEAAVEENGEGGSNLTVNMENHKQRIETFATVESTCFCRSLCGQYT